MKETLIKSNERVKKYGEVFTPEWVVKQMCNNLPTEAWEIDSTILEPACGTGNFLVEIFARKLKNCQTPEDGIRALQSIYGIDIQPDNVFESRKRLADMFLERFGLVPETLKAADIISHNIICGDFLKLAKTVKNGTWEDVRREATKSEVENNKKDYNERYRERLSKENCCQRCRKPKDF